MPVVSYRPADVLHWFGVKSSEAKLRARKKSKAALAGTDLLQGIKDMAGAATDFGRGAVTDLVQRQAEETTYSLADDAFEVVNIASRKRVAYSDVTQISAKAHDRFEVTHKNGRIVVRPIAHLVAGRMRVPVGWTRNGMEVPYALLIEELSARAGVEIVSE